MREQRTGEIMQKAYYDDVKGTYYVVHEQMGNCPLDGCETGKQPTTPSNPNATFQDVILDKLVNLRVMINQKASISELDDRATKEELDLKLSIGDFEVNNKKVCCDMDKKVSREEMEFAVKSLTEQLYGFASHKAVNDFENTILDRIRLSEKNVTSAKDLEDATELMATKEELKIYIDTITDDINGMVSLKIFDDFSEDLHKQVNKNSNELTGVYKQISNLVSHSVLSDFENNILEKIDIIDDKYELIDVVIKDIKLFVESAKDTFELTDKKLDNLKEGYDIFKELTDKRLDSVENQVGLLIEDRKNDGIIKRMEYNDTVNKLNIHIDEKLNITDANKMENSLIDRINALPGDSGTIHNHDGVYIKLSEKTNITKEIESIIRGELDGRYIETSIKQLMVDDIKTSVLDETNSKFVPIIEKDRIYSRINDKYDESSSNLTTAIHNVNDNISDQKTELESKIETKANDILDMVDVKDGVVLKAINDKYVEVLNEADKKDLEVIKKINEKATEILADVVLKDEMVMNSVNTKEASILEKIKKESDILKKDSSDKDLEVIKAIDQSKIDIMVDVNSKDTAIYTAIEDKSVEILSKVDEKDIIVTNAFIKKAEDTLKDAIEKDAELLLVVNGTIDNVIKSTDTKDAIINNTIIEKENSILKVVNDNDISVRASLDTRINDTLKTVDEKDAIINNTIIEKEKSILKVVDDKEVILRSVIDTKETSILKNTEDNYINKSDRANIINETRTSIIDGSPEALDTLKELSNAINNDETFATNIIKQISDVKDITDSNITKISKNISDIVILDSEVEKNTISVATHEVSLNNLHTSVDNNTEEIRKIKDDELPKISVNKVNLDNTKQDLIDLTLVVDGKVDSAVLRETSLMLGKLIDTKADSQTVYGRINEKANISLLETKSDKGHKHDDIYIKLSDKADLMDELAELVYQRIKAGQ